MQPLQSILSHPITLLTGNYASLMSEAEQTQAQTNEAFSAKWKQYHNAEEQAAYFAMQKQWYLTLYGFADEAALAAHLAQCSVIYDAGCGLGFKAAWFAELAPHALVVAMDYSEAAEIAARTYAHLANLVFLRGDIAQPHFLAGSIDYVSCDQVIMHTQNPALTFAELARITKPKGHFACYFYAKKALPRELLDSYFREHCRTLSEQELWDMSAQLTELGKRLSALNTTIDAPAIPALGIKAGRYDIQRFIYWHFLKCYWNPELGEETSTMTNFDWYSPSNAQRFSEEDVRQLIDSERLAIAHFHSEEACYSGRFVKP